MDQMPIAPARERKVGVMGLGPIGLAAANTLAAAGFQVAGWVRRPRSADGIEIFSGREGLAAFLARSEIVVNLLPLTPETRGILNAGTLKALPAGASIVNLGRGEHVVEVDLIAALDSGHLAGATLDVFPVEPLPVDSPLWRIRRSPSCRTSRAGWCRWSLRRACLTSSRIFAQGVRSPNWSIARAATSVADCRRRPMLHRVAETATRGACVSS